MLLGRLVLALPSSDDGIFAPLPAPFLAVH